MEEKQGSISGDPEAKSKKALTPEQQENIKIIEGIKEKYPGALTEIGEEGSGSYVVSKTPPDYWRLEAYLLHKDGIFDIKKDEKWGNISQINPDAVVTSYSQKTPVRFSQGWVEVESGVQKLGNVSIRRINLNSSGEREKLKKALQKAQQRSNELNDGPLKEERQPSAEEVLADL